METGVMSESLVVPSDVHQTVTEVLGQLVLDDLKQTDITVKLLQEQVELNLGYSEGSLNKWHNALSTAIREFFRGVQWKNPPSLQTALTWASQVPQPAAPGRHRPPVGKVWNGTAKAIHDAGGKLTGYEGAWVHADADVQPAFAGVEPQKKPAYRPPTGKVWNGTANAMSNTAGVVTAYAGAWVPAPVATDGDSHGNAGVMPDGASCDNAGVPPKRQPHGRVPQGKVWNGTANPLKDDAGVVTGYTGAWVCAESDGDADSDHGVPPRRKPHGRVPEGMVWNGTANPLKDDEGVVSGYAGGWVRAESDGDTDADHDSSDNGSECLHDVSHNAGKKRSRTNVDRDTDPSMQSGKISSLG